MIATAVIGYKAWCVRLCSLPRCPHTVYRTHHMFLKVALSRAAPTSRALRLLWLLVKSGAGYSLLWVRLTRPRTAMLSPASPSGYSCSAGRYRRGRLLLPTLYDLIHQRLCVPRRHPYHRPVWAPRPHFRLRRNGVPHRTSTPRARCAIGMLTSRVGSAGGIPYAHHRLREPRP